MLHLTAKSCIFPSLWYPILSSIRSSIASLSIEHALYFSILKYNKRNTPGMTAITIKEEAPLESGGWQATLSFNNGPQYHVTITDPFSKEQEKDSSTNTIVSSTL